MTRDEAFDKALEQYMITVPHEEGRAAFMRSLAARGFAFVPVRPTDEMITVGAEWVGDAVKTFRAYRAMISAAQEDSHE